MPRDGAIIFSDVIGRLDDGPHRRKNAGRKPAFLSGRAIARNHFHDQNRRHHHHGHQDRHRHRPNRRAVKVPIAIFMLMALVRLCSF